MQQICAVNLVRWELRTLLFYNRLRTDEQNRKYLLGMMSMSVVFIYFYTLGFIELKYPRKDVFCLLCKINIIE